MTPAGLRLLLDERGDRLDAAEGKATRRPTATPVAQQYASPVEFAALANMKT